MSKKSSWRAVEVPKLKPVSLCAEEGCQRPVHSRRRCFSCYRALRSTAALGKLALEASVVEQVFREAAPCSLGVFADRLGVGLSTARAWIAKLIGSEVARVDIRSASGQRRKGQQTLYEVCPAPEDEEYRSAACRTLESGGTVAPEMVPVEEAVAELEVERGRLRKKGERRRRSGGSSA